MLVQVEILTRQGAPETMQGQMEGGIVVFHGPEPDRLSVLSGEFPGQDAQFPERPGDAAAPIRPNKKIIQSWN